MTTKLYKLNLLLPLLFVHLLAFSHAAQAQQPPVVIKTFGQHLGGNIVNNYQITNNSNRDVVGVAIGLDTDQTSPNSPPTREQGEFNFVMPVGSDMLNLEVNPASISGPAGWTAEIIQIEDGGRFIQWRKPPRPGQPLQPGQTYRFSITVPGIIDDAYLIKHFSVRLSELSGVPSGTAYLTGHFSAGYADGKEPWHYNGVMEKLDVTPPTLAVTLNPNTLHPNKKLVPITATITIIDDYDPAPEIKLESITPSELSKPGDIRDVNLGTDDRQFMLKAERGGKNKAGRFYTVIYSATDASGNKATASATVTVPHDKRGHEDRRDDEHGDKERRDDKDKKDRGEHKRDR